MLLESLQDRVGLKAGALERLCKFELQDRWWLLGELLELRVRWDARLRRKWGAHEGCKAGLRMWFYMLGPKFPLQLFE